jgi:outer membrane beta-barrel protein
VNRELALALGAALLAAGAPLGARASEADAFENKIRPISGQLYQKAGRLELTPGAELSLNDAFFKKYLFGARATWHFAEWLSLGGSFATGFADETGSTQVCPPNQGCRAATAAQLAAVPGEIKRRASVEVGFSPVYAKLNFLAEKVLHFDLSLLAGADWISYRAVLPAPTDPGAAVSPGTASAVGGHLGLGSRVFLGEWGALRLDFKDVLYRAEVADRKKWQQQLLFEVGVSLFLPLSNRAP